MPPLIPRRTRKERVMGIPTDLPRATSPPAPLLKERGDKIYFKPLSFRRGVGVRSVHLGRLRLLDRGRLGLLGLGRRGTIAPLDHRLVDLFQRDPGGLALAGLDLGAGAPHDLLGAGGGDEHTPEFAVHGWPLLIHRNCLLGGVRIAAGRIHLSRREGSPVPGNPAGSPEPWAACGAAGVVYRE